MVVVCRSRTTRSEDPDRTTERNEPVHENQMNQFLGSVGSLHLLIIWFG